MSGIRSPPSALGKYQIRGVLGRGAMGTVYDGWDPAIGRRVAIKTVRLLDPDDAEARDALARFKNEAQAAGRLSHRNIVSVYDYGESDENAYIVMEFVEGQSLKQCLDAGQRFPIAETVRIMEHLLAGLQYSHDKGVMHRDIKPGNVILAKDGQVKLADFGIARIESSAMTVVGTVLGTPAYMSPEQLMGQPTDRRTDIYSAGVLLYQLLTGVRPFEGGLTVIMHKALNTTPPRPSTVAVAAPASLDPVVARAMAKQPASRFPNAAAFARAIGTAFAAAAAGPSQLGGRVNDLGGPVDDDEATIVVPSGRPAAKPDGAPTAPRPTRRAARHRPAVLRGAGLIGLGLLGGVIWFALRPLPPAFRQTVVVPSPTAPTTEPSDPAQQPSAEAAASSPDPPTETGAPRPASEPRPSTTMPPPSQPADPAPERVALAGANAAATRETLRSIANSAYCALPRFSVGEDGRIGLSGAVGAGTPEAALRDAVQAGFPGETLIWETRGVDGPYCDLFDTIRPIAETGSPGLGVGLKDGVTRLNAGQFVLPIVNMPDFPTYLQVDYFAHDGSVAHLFPPRGAPNPVFASNATVTLGQDHGKPNLEVAAPFGADLIVAVASSDPLFAGPVREDETEQTYLPALKAAIEAAERRGAKLIARALVVDTVER
jgi:eukaryotic-like serine/threonine-protein kinase